MGWDDEDDDWPTERETDPEVIAKKRENDPFDPLRGSLHRPAS